MLVKLTCRGRTFEAAVARSRRALAEFRIRGVSTNIPFLQAVLADPEFVAGDVSTAFIEQRPELLTTHVPADRGTRMLRWLAEVTVNKPYGDRADPARSAGQAARRGRPRPAVTARLAAAAAGARARTASPPICAPAPASRSPTPRSATRTSPCWPPGCGPRTCCGSPRTWAGPCPSCCRSSAGAGPRTTSRSASCRRTRGSGWRCCATTCRGCACRCCCGAATRSATPRTRPRSPPPSWRRRPRSASTSSASSTP